MNLGCDDKEDNEVDNVMGSENGAAVESKEEYNDEPINNPSIDVELHNSNNERIDGTTLTWMRDYIRDEVFQRKKITSICPYLLQLI